MKSRYLRLFLVLILVVLALAACGGDDDDKENATPVPEAGQADVEGKKVFFIESYATDYPYSVELTTALETAFQGTGVELKTVHMDTRNNPDPAYGESKGAEIKAEIDEFKPDIVIACDDGAQKYVVVPYLLGTDIPVIFCGVNWSAEKYGFPASNVTGMIEVDLIEQLLANLRPFANGDRVAWVSTESSAGQAVVDAYQSRFFDNTLQVVWTEFTVESFQESFLAAQEQADIVIVANNASIEEWDEAAMRQFFAENTRVPTGTVNVWMTPYALMGLPKNNQEQAEWAVQSALEVLRGKPLADIPIAENQIGNMVINLTIAETLDISFSPDILRNAQTVE